MIGVDKLTLTIQYADTAAEQLQPVQELYAEVYAEPPYNESESDVQQFISGWPRRCKATNFRLVIARSRDHVIGFAFGHSLGPHTRWWGGALNPLPPELTTEHGGRTFAIIEIAVQQKYRQQGVGRALHTHLIAGLIEERVTLCVRPDAPAPQHAYHNWGYHTIGRIQPFPESPVYDAMIKTLHG